jgi:hypothetical protein
MYLPASMLDDLRRSAAANERGLSAELRFYLKEYMEGSGRRR